LLYPGAQSCVQLPPLGKPEIPHVQFPARRGNAENVSIKQLAVHASERFEDTHSPVEVQFNKLEPAVAV